MTLALISHADFLQAQASDPYFRGRWDYLAEVLHLLRGLHARRVLELGPHRLPLVRDSHVMDVRPHLPGTLQYDARDTPWPVADGAYDLFIALQVWEHLGDRQREAFAEVRRIAGQAVLSFPLRWDVPHDPVHHDISEERIAQWTLGVAPERSVRVRTGRFERLIQHFDFRPSPSPENDQAGAGVRPPLSLEARTRERCPHRVSTSDAGPAGFTCELLSELLGAGRALARVEPDACAACCRHPLPTREHLNPALGALLSRSAGRIVQLGGVEGCPAGEARRLRERGRHHLRPAGLPDPLLLAQRRLHEPCCHLGRRIDDATDAADAEYVCRHPRHARTTPEQCRRCVDWSDHPRPDPHPLARRIPAPASRTGPPVRHWSVGVTTAPREPATLEYCLDSLVRCGWTRPHVFADAGTNLPPRFAHLDTTHRGTQLGAWPNYLLSLSEMLHYRPDADAYLLVQDDALFYDRLPLRDELEQLLWPGDRLGIVSLYCSAADTRPDAGWHRHDGPWAWGALAFVFPRELARQFVSDPRVLAHRWSGPRQGTAQIDVVIGRWAERHEIPVMFPVPSVVQHVGHRSTIWEPALVAGRRRADRFLGDDD